jgi:hypothetical protein
MWSSYVGQGKVAVLGREVRRGRLMWDRQRLLLSCVRQKEVAVMRGAELGGRLVGGQGKVAVMCRSGHDGQNELGILCKAGRSECLV